MGFKESKVSSRVPPAVYYIRIAFFAHVSCCQCRHQSDPSGSLPPPAASIPSLLLQVKPQLKMACSRLQIASNKKTALMKQQMRSIATLLAEQPTPKEEKARIRAEALIREDNTVEAYELLQLQCELLFERIKLIATSKECPEDLVSCISTLMWSAPRVDIPELGEIRRQFRHKYGKEFEGRAVNNVGGVVNERIVAKLSVQPPSAYLVQTYLEKICDEFGVEWKPLVKLGAEDLSAPMVAPVGYTVQVAPGTGLAPPGVPPPPSAPPPGWRTWEEEDRRGRCRTSRPRRQSPCRPRRPRGTWLQRRPHRSTWRSRIFLFPQPPVRVAVTIRAAGAAGRRETATGRTAATPADSRTMTLRHGSLSWKSREAKVGQDLDI